MSLLSVIGSYEEAWKAIIMPPRQDYSMHDLGTTEFFVEDTRVQRSDFRLLNKRGQTIECSFFQPAGVEEAIPCVIYLHANGCCRLEVMSYLEVLSNPVSLFCFDFSGCGKSGGQYTSVGWFEQDDLECVIQYLCNTGKVTKIAVWGRSMGAVTSILYSGKDPRITCLILDSPFAKFKQLVKELAKEKANIPGFLTEGAFSIIRSTIKSKANFDLEDLRPIKHVDKIKIPALFGAAKEDTFVSPQHTRDLYMGYGGQKQLMIFEGDHNSQRPSNWMQLVKEFIKVHLLGEKTDTQPFKQVYNPVENPVQEPTDDSKDRQNTKASNDISPSLPYNGSFSSMHFSWLEHSSSSPDLNKTGASKLPGLSERSMSGISASTQDQNAPTEPKPATRRLFDLFLSDKKKKTLNESQTLQKSSTISLTQQILEGTSLQTTQRINDNRENDPTPKGAKDSGRSNRPNSSSISIFGPKKTKAPTEDLFQNPLFQLNKSTDKSLKEISTNNNSQKAEESKKSYLKGYHEFHINSEQPNPVPHKPMKSKSINFQQQESQTARPLQRSQTHQFEVQKQLAKKENISPPQNSQKPVLNTTRPSSSNQNQGQFVHLNTNVFVHKTNEVRQMDIRKSSDHIMKLYPVVGENDHENQVKFSNRTGQNTDRLKTSGSVLLNNSNTSTKKYTIDLSQKSSQYELLKMQGIVK